MTGGVLFIILFAFLLIGVPVWAGIAGCCTIFMQSEGLNIFNLVQRMFSAVDKTTLLALPGFLIAGNLMDEGGLAKKLVNICELLVAKIPGGLPIVTSISSAVFGAISGSGVATTAIVGGIMQPEMESRGYKGEYVGALITSGGVLDAVIPPSIILVVYGAATNTSIGDLFKTGFAAGALMLISVCILCIIQATRQKGVKLEKKVYTKDQIIAILKESIPALLAPILIIVGIFGGFVTPTECSCILIAYVIIICTFLYKKLTLKSIWESFKKGALQSAAILMIMAAAGIFGWIIAYTKLPNHLMASIVGITDNRVLIMLAVLVCVFVAGMFMSGTAIVVILAPILSVICATLGINGVHFGTVILMCLALGCMTPPFGTCLYAASMVTRKPVEKIAYQVLPFIITYMIDIVLVVLVPKVVMWIV